MPSDPVRIVDKEHQLIEKANPLPVYLTGETLEETSAGIVISYPHHEIHEGSYFGVSHLTANGADLADDASLILAIITGDKVPHFEGLGACGGDAEIRLYEGANVDPDGTLLTPSNHDRTSLKVSTVVVRLNPTVNDSGNALPGVYMPGGTGGNAIGIAGGQRVEFKLAPNTTYLLILTNRAGNAQPAYIAAEWYEESVE